MALRYGIVFIPRDDDRGSLGQRLFHGFKCFSAHDDMMAQCGLFKMLQIARQFPGQMVVLSYYVIFCPGYNDGYFHNLVFFMGFFTRYKVQRRN